MAKGRGQAGVLTQLRMFLLGQMEYPLGRSYGLPGFILADVCAAAVISGLAQPHRKE